MLEGKKCLVIGSGISGIGAAVLLEKNHADVVLYDSSDKLTGEDLKAKLPEGSRAACIAGELQRFLFARRGPHHRYAQPF